MKPISKHTKLIPYLYFIMVIALWFTVVNREEGIIAYPILLFTVPFLWQIVKPSKKLNFSLGITFVCLSSYLIIAYFSNLFNIASILVIKGFIFFGSIFVVVNFLMSIWIIKNSTKTSF